MKILALETSSDLEGVAIFADGKILVNCQIRVQTGHSQKLLSLIDWSLSQAGMGVKQLDCLAVSLGPGSFTGLRIGLATAKGICLAQELPLIGIPTLDGLAFGFPLSSFPICPLLDARRGEVYAAIYYREEGRLERKSSWLVLGIEELGSRIEEKTVFLGEGVRVYREELRKELGERAVFAPEEWSEPSPVNIARLAKDRFEVEGRGDLDDIEPLYLRRPPAKPREG